MPMPVSNTSNLILASVSDCVSASTLTVIEPFSVNLTAFPMRFTNTCLICKFSPLSINGVSFFKLNENSIPLICVSGLNRLVVLTNNSLRLKFSTRLATLPLSISVKSSTLLTSCTNNSDELLTTFSNSFCSNFV